jgi:hypothetical protein
MPWARLVLEPAERWLAGEVLVRRRVNVAARLEHRIAMQHGRVIAVLIAQRDPVDALPEQFDQRVLNIPRIARNRQRR